MPLTGADTARFYQWWNDLSETLTHQNRHFNSVAEAILKKVFEGIEDLKVGNDEPLLRSIGSGTETPDLFRARSFSSLTEVPDAVDRPDMEVGPPPAYYAGNGRLNSRHQAVFYGALDTPTARSEIRPPVGSYVVVAKFEILRELKILDLSKLRQILENGQLFDKLAETDKPRLSNLMFLGEHFAKPVQPGNESNEYVVTQAIADFLASMKSPSLDGVAYRSAQLPGGTNIALFHKASFIDPIVLKKQVNHVRLVNRSADGKIQSDVPLIDQTATLHRLLARPDSTITFELVETDLKDESAANRNTGDRRTPSLRTSRENVEVSYIEAASFSPSVVPWSVGE